MADIISLPGSGVGVVGNGGSEVVSGPCVVSSSVVIMISGFEINFWG